MLNEFKLVTADKFKGDLVGREVVVAPEYHEEFQELFQNKGLSPHDFFKVRTVWEAGREQYLGFVLSPRDPGHEFFSPYDGTTCAKFFHVMP